MNETHFSETVLFLPKKKITVIILVVLFLLGGIGIRLIDFTDLPLDFASTRQFHSLLLARSYYYQMDTPDTLSMPQELRTFAINKAKAEPIVEPPILEHLVALTYRVIGHEYILVGRIYSIFFWVLGGIPIFLLSRRLLSTNGAFAVLAYYLFEHFGVLASRSFQPDSMMIMFLLWALYFQVRWSQADTLKNAILAGVFTGLAVLVKAPMVFFAGLPFAFVILQKGSKYWIRNGRVYLMAVLAIAPGLLYNLLSATVGGNAGAILGGRFYPQLYVQLSWYLQWMITIKAVAGQVPLVIGLLAFFLIKDVKTRTLYAGLWLGYLLYGFTFAYHIYSHNYYQMPLLVILALGFGIGLSYVFKILEEHNPQWIARAAVMLIFIFSIGMIAQRVYSYLNQSDFRDKAAYFTELGNIVGQNVSVVALTEDYGYPLSYWSYIGPSLWPRTADRDLKNIVGASDPGFQQLFKELTVGKDVFLVTMPDEFDKQTDLKEHLLSTYPVQQGDGYYIFNLALPLVESN
ncbi:MAG: glycosyltransferase family 39 protein [Anaerolineaceae bacterium]|nr:glycosyltransferase family 39 protein [Anaerolineaceae bacterium]